MLDVREISAADVEPLASAITAEGMVPDLEDGIWLGAFEDGALIGVARVFARAGDAMLEDLWVTPERRARGAGIALVRAAQERRSPLWLICDEDMVEYYAYQGFVRASESFPEPLAEVCRPKGYWQPEDHAHIAMRWERFTSPDLEAELQAIARELTDEG